MKNNNIKIVLTEAERKMRVRSILLLLCALVSIFILLVQGIYRKLNVNISNSFDVLYGAIWLLFTIENLYRLVKHKRNHTLADYRENNISEILYLIASIIIVPFSFFISAFDLMRWIILLKLPGILKEFNDEKVFQITIKIITVIFMVFFLFPFLNVIAVSFSSPGEIVNVLPKKFNLFSVKYVLGDNAFIKSISVSIFVTIVGTFISVISMAMAAYPLSKTDMPLRKTMMMFFMIVMLFSGGMAPHILLINSLHLTNTVWALIFPSVVMVFHLLLLKGFFESVPKELEESSKLDGANNYTIFFRIIVPVAMPMIATVTFFTAINYWNNINNSILYITSNQNIYPLPMYIKNFLSRNPMEIAQSNPELLPYWDNLKMSYILFSIVPIACVYPFIFKYIKNGVSVGAVKG